MRTAAGAIFYRSRAASYEAPPRVYATALQLGVTSPILYSLRKLWPYALPSTLRRMKALSIPTQQKLIHGSQLYHHAKECFPWCHSLIAKKNVKKKHGSINLEYNFDGCVSKLAGFHKRIALKCWILSGLIYRMSETFDITEWISEK